MKAVGYLQEKRVVVEAIHQRLFLDNALCVGQVEIVQLRQPFDTSFTELLAPDGRGHGVVFKSSFDRCFLTLFGDKLSEDRQRPLSGSS